jgi:phage protein U
MAINWREVRTGLLDVAQDAFQRNDSGNVPVMMMLGGFKFSIATAAYTECSRTSKFRWPKIDRYGKLATRQYTGPDEDAITLPGSIYPEWRGGYGQLDDLRNLAAQGRPQRLIDGFGRMLGWWVIEEVTDKQTFHNRDGTPRRMDFMLTLARIPDDQAVES